MQLDTTQFIGYGLDLNQLQTIVTETTMNQPAYEESLKNILKKHSYTDYIEDFNNEVAENHLPEVSYLTDRNVIYFNNQALVHFANIHNVIPMLINCVAEILWSEYSAQFDGGNYLTDEDTFFSTVKEALNSRQKTLFRQIKA